MNKIKRLVTHAVKLLQYYIDRVWYLPLLAILAAVDTFLVIIPSDGIAISSSMLKPSKWFYFGIFSAIGSTIGGVALCYIVQHYGIQAVDSFFPHLQASSIWIHTQKFFDEYGLWLLFAIAATPLSQQPVLILAALARIPLFEILLITLAGRSIKFCLLTYIGSHAPHLLKKLWGEQDELREMGID